MLGKIPRLKKPSSKASPTTPKLDPTLAELELRWRNAQAAEDHYRREAKRYRQEYIDAAARIAGRGRAA